MQPTKNARGLDVIPMTDEQKYTLDVKGWVALPGVLDETLCKEARDQITDIVSSQDKDAKADKPAVWGSGWEGPCQELLDHPAAVGVLNEVLSHQANAREDAYGFRVDNGFITVRKNNGDNRWGPHGGGGYFNFGGNSHTYHMLPGKINTGLTRLVWELNPVGKDDGGTKFLSGSHKAAFSLPDEVKNNREHPMWETYECPAGSLLVFTEALTHTGTAWTNSDRDRVAYFVCYNTIGNKFHSGGPTKEQIDTMPKMRQGLFRAPWVWTGGADRNFEYDAEHNFAF